MNQEYYFKKIIIGGSLESLFYSFATDTPIIIKEAIVPFELERFDSSCDMGFMGYENTRGVYKAELWDRLSFLLSMNGMIMFPNIIKNIRSQSSAFYITTQNNDRIKVSYKEKIEYDKIIESSVDVYDWFDVRSGMSHHHVLLRDEKSNFIKKLYFYPSKRKGFNRFKKDIVTYSSISKKKILDYEYSEGYARLKVLKMMKEEGIRGRANGYNKNGVQLHYAVNIEHTHRDIVKKYKPLYTIDETINKMKKQGKTWNLAKKLFRQKQTTTSQELYQLPDYL